MNWIDGGVCTVQEAEPHFRSERGSKVARAAGRSTVPSTTASRTDPPIANARPQLASKHSRGPTPSRPRALARSWFTCLSGAFAATLAFAAAMWLTGQAPIPPTVAILASASVANATSLMAAVQTAGLRGSPDVKGAIETLKRIDDRRVTIKGWAVDKASPSSSLTIVAFAAGQHVLTAATDGPRKDVALMLGLPDSGARTAAFETTFSCASGQNLVVVAVTSDRTYSQFRSLACP